MDDAFSTRDIARYCGVSRVTVWKWIKRGLLPASRDSAGRYVVSKDMLQRFLRRQGYAVDPKVFQRPKRVLIVDDEPSVVEVVSRALHQIQADIHVATADDGFEAGLQTATFRPDLLILDLMMPRMNGFQVCRLIRQDPTASYTKILIITAFGSRENIDRAIAAGADDVQHKPIEINGLKRKVTALLGIDG